MILRRLRDLETMLNFVLAVVLNLFRLTFHHVTCSLICWFCFRTNIIRIENFHLSLWLLMGRLQVINIDTWPNNLCFTYPTSIEKYNKKENLKPPGRKRFASWHPKITLLPVHSGKTVFGWVCKGCLCVFLLLWLELLLGWWTWNFSPHVQGLHGNHGYPVL